MSFTFDPFNLGEKDADTIGADNSVLLTDPTAPRELEQYWASLPRQDGVPFRSDVEPRELGPLLSHCFVLERVAPGVARFRVAGRAVTDLIGMDPRGMPLSALFAPASRAAISTYLEGAFTHPNLVDLSLDSPKSDEQPRLQGKILLLPLRDDQGNVTRLLGSLVMSGMRGVGPRRFRISYATAPRVERLMPDRPATGLGIASTTPKRAAPIAFPSVKPALELVEQSTPPFHTAQPTPRRQGHLRLVVCND